MFSFWQCEQPPTSQVVYKVDNIRDPSHEEVLLLRREEGAVVRDEQTTRARHEAAYEIYRKLAGNHRCEPRILSLEDIGKIVDAAMDHPHPWFQSLLVAVEEAPQDGLPWMLKTTPLDVIPDGPRYIYIDIPENVQDLPQKVDIDFDVKSIHIGLKET